jgi:hypothetical protein
MSRTVPLAKLLELKKQLREERRLRSQAEADRDAIRTTLANVLQGLKDGER